MVDEEKAAAILEAAKKERRGTSRSVWILASLIGVVCTIGFVVLLFSRGGSSSPPSESHHVTEHGPLGFGFGLLFGVVIGVGVGYSIARQRQSSRNTP